MFCSLFGKSENDITQHKERKMFPPDQKLAYDCWEGLEDHGPCYRYLLEGGGLCCCACQEVAQKQQFFGMWHWNIWASNIGWTSTTFGSVRFQLLATVVAQAVVGVIRVGWWLVGGWLVVGVGCFFSILLWRQLLTLENLRLTSKFQYLKVSITVQPRWPAVVAGSLGTLNWWNSRCFWALRTP